MVDVVIRGDTVVTPAGAGAYDVAIAGETIVAATPAAAGAAVPEGARLIDAAGKIAIPGGIDPHVHCKWPLPNPGGSWGDTDPPEVVSRAALHGGTTAIIDFTRASQGSSVQDAIEKRERDWTGRCACDYAQHIMVEGALPLDLYPQLAEAIQAGFPTAKIFTTDITPSRKGRMVDFGDTTGGNAGVEPRVSLMYSEMVGRRGYTLERFADLVSSNAARIMGLYPRKGAIAAGSDADICILDPALRRTLRKEDLHETDYSPWEGHEMHAWPGHVLLRGKLVLDGGRYTGDPADGKWLPRKVDAAMIGSPQL